MVTRQVLNSKEKTKVKRTSVFAPPLAVGPGLISRPTPLRLPLVAPCSADSWSGSRKRVNGSSCAVGRARNQRCACCKHGRRSEPLGPRVRFSHQRGQHRPDRRVSLLARVHRRLLDGSLAVAEPGLAVEGFVNVRSVDGAPRLQEKKLILSDGARRGRQSGSCGGGGQRKARGAHGGAQRLHRRRWRGWSAAARRRTAAGATARCGGAP